MGLIGRRLVAAMAVLAAGSVVSACECPQIRQQVYIATPDATLAPLVEACRTGIPPQGQTCERSSDRVETSIPCPCLPLCRRVLELIDQFSGDETLISCQLSARTAIGTGTGGAASGGAGGRGGAGGTAAGGAGAGGTGSDTRPLVGRFGTVEVVVTYRPSTCE